MKVSVYRYEEELIPEGRFQEYEVPIPEGDVWTVMDVLEYIALHLDPTLAYYKHSVCNHGICGRCLMRVNGAPKLACICTVDPNAPLKLEPAAGRAPVRDLVTRD